DNIAATISGITTESDIENMIKAKGFADCVTFVNGDKINVAVQTGGTALDGASVAQIRDIVLGKMETQAKNITIVEVK
ncbi:MAG: SpoIIIAH-like family protein, partial [Ruthenibacterium sp.]